MFAREDVAGVLNVLDEEVVPFPPSRITDLKSGVNPDAKEIILTWTAPGNQLDHGNGKGLGSFMNSSIRKYFINN